MILSSDELEILDYLKSWKGKFVAMVEICRCAGGRKKFKEDANWAKPLMARLVEGKLAEVNERGHYRVAEEQKPDKKKGHGVLGDDYFPKGNNSELVGEDYFPAPTEPEPVPERWLSPQMAQILKRAGKKISHKGAS